MAVVSPYQFYLQAKEVSPGLSPGIERPPPEELSPPENTPLHRRLVRWALAAGGFLGVVYAPQAQEIPAVPPAPAQAAPARTPSAPTARFEIPQEHVTAAVHHVAAYAAPAEGTSVPTITVVNLPPEQAELVVHITRDINAGSDHTIDIVVQAQKQPPTEAEVKEAKNTYRWIVAAGILVGNKVLEKGIDKGIDFAWRELKKKTKRLRDANASRPNPILAQMAEASDALEQIFGPPDAEPKILSITLIGEKLGCSREQAEAILQPGPFVESSPGFWRLDPDFEMEDLFVSTRRTKRRQDAG